MEKIRLFFLLMTFFSMLLSGCKNFLHQDPLCKNTSCMSLDARNQGCAIDAETILEEKINGISIELRYSAKCDASWSRAIVPPGSRIYVEDAQGKKYGDNYRIPPNDPVKGAHYGNMGPGRNLKACIEIPKKQVICTKTAS
ncbi:DUF2690 domain-containing protein [Microcoleus sp. FACHB-SPT15]|uniref:DUF2690 domain-containing protein n=1 Tax=Microcoleus sp. FACHB-SPT15 TaxID=2692830 RepID=UPI001785876E|nr:DUF2690 domain-containing protein [Microcoleus sp. FACHB-SPT15]MBD1808864.1 DUF2690 domain-containing protein [Microcoleus sp. FACHB-SPT15]